MKTLLYLLTLSILINNSLLAQEIETTESVIQTEHKTHHSNGQLKEYCLYDKNEKLHGVWKSYYESGQLKETGEYNAGKKTGTWKAYHTNGKVWETSTYNKDGLHTGEIRQYHDNGKPVRVGKTIKPGIIKWVKNYDIEGRLVDKNLATFKWVTYNDDGTRRRSGEYKNKKKVGKWTWYNRDGTVDFTAIKKDDKTEEIKSFYRNGKIEKITKYKDDKIAIYRIKYYEKTSKIEYEHKEESGFWVKRFYYPNGQLSEVRKYKSGRKDGQWTSHHRNGKIAFTKQYRQGEKVGKWAKYNKAGQP